MLNRFLLARHSEYVGLLGTPCVLIVVSEEGALSVLIPVHSVTIKKGLT